MGQGTIERDKAPDGTFRYRVRLDSGPDPATGKRRQQQHTVRTRREAEAWLRQRLAELAGGASQVDDKLTMAALMEAWLDTCVTQDLAPGTLLTYRTTVRRHIIPALGALRVRDLRARDLDAFYASKRASGCSAHLVNRCHLRLHQALAYARRRRIVVSNEADLSDPPRVPHEEMKTWTQEEVDRALSAAKGTRYGVVWTVLVGTGMRRGELMGLRWTDLDLDRGELRIVQAIPLVGATLESGPPKTPSAKRTLPLDPAVVSALREERTRQNERRLALGSAWSDQGLVCCADDGRPAHPSTLHRHFGALAADADCTPIRIHDLRHTYATLALQAGADIAGLSRLLGHAKISITMDLYGHVTPRMQQAAARIAGAAIFANHAANE